MKIIATNRKTGKKVVATLKKHPIINVTTRAHVPYRKASKTA